MEFRLEAAVSLEQASGIPDLFKIFPRLWSEPGFPYMIYTDRTIQSSPRTNPLDSRGLIKFVCSISLRPNDW